MNSAGKTSERPPKAPPMVILRTFTLESGNLNAFDSAFALVWGDAFGIQTSMEPSAW